MVRCSRLGLLSLLSLLACGDSVTFIECPPGTTPSGSQCLTPDVTVPDELTPDAATEQPEIYDPDAPFPDFDPGPDTDLATETSGGDTQADAPVETASPRPTGSMCARNADCAGGTCLDWTGGYCTRLDCADDGECGVGERCLAFQGNRLCVARCERDLDCRVPDQACKILVDAADTVSVCMGVHTTARGTGAPCADATDCAGRATCLAAFPGGYCATLGCDVAGCPAGDSCVRVDGRPSCLRRCTGDGDCAGEVGAERRCGVLESTAASPVDVCISGIEGKELGESCRSDFECTSASCQILGEGRCSQTGWPCFPQSVGTDCNGAEFCQVTPESRVGLCSQRCALGGRTCPGAAHCLAEGDSPRSAWCRPACDGPGDPSCNAAAGLVCAFGIPVSDSGQGRYACTRSSAGNTLTPCNGDATCAGGVCLLDGTSGYCAAGCGEDSHCAFGGACVFGATDRCYRACLSSQDCMSGYRCESLAGASRDVCVP